MVAVVAKLSAGRAHAPTPATTGDKEAMLLKSVRAALDNYLQGRKLVAVKFRQIEGNNLYGFLKMEGKGERHLVDFKATATPEGRLSSLEVDGKRITLDLDPAPKRTR